MALPFPINPNQTDAKSPIDQQLMDAIRLNQEFLDAQVGGGSAGGILNFRVNGLLRLIKPTLSSGGGKRLDGGIISNAVTFTQAKLYLEQGGNAGALEVDVLRHKELQHAIENVTAQYEGDTQAVGRLGSSINTQAISIATPVIDTQQITKPKSSVNIETIAALGNGNFLYVFSGLTPLDADYSIGDPIQFSGCTNALNDGEFAIVNINYDGLPSIIINNPSGVEQDAAAGTGDLSIYEYTFLASVDDDIVAGEEIILAGHTEPNNDGTKTIYKTNQAGNNIWVKHFGGDTQGGVAGTATCTRWVYAFATTPDDTHYIVGEKAEFAGHTSGANDGKFLIKRINEAGNNLYVTNSAGVSQGGAGGTTDTLRWLYSTADDPSTDVTALDKIIMLGHTNPLNDGTFTVQFVKRFAINNLEVYNEDGIAQVGIAGTYESTLRLINFKEDFATSFIVTTSKVAIEGLTSSSGLVPEREVLEINRGGGANFNIVLDAEEIPLQTVTSGRVAREVRTIFNQRPKLDTANEGIVRNLQKDDGATFALGGVEANTILTLDIISIPDGDPQTMVLSLL